jgi:GT2 family glycosyltransferase
MKTPSVTVQIPNYNGIRYLKDCLDSVLATDYNDFDVIVIDNASTDGSVEFVKKNYPQIKLVENKKNYGFAAALNKNSDALRSEYIAFLNNDVVVESKWLGILVDYMEKSRVVAAANPKILFLQDRKKVNSAGGNCDIYGVGWNRGNGEMDNGQYDKVEEVFYANGAALVIRKEAWLDVGKFDEDYFLYGEDLDWCWRARLKGYKILYSPEAKIYHRWMGSGGSMIQLLEMHWMTNLLKNYTPRTLCAITPKYFTLKMLKAAWLMRNGEQLPEKLAVFKAFVWNLKNFRKTWRKHSIIQLSRKMSDKQIQKSMYNGSFELQLWLGKMKHPLIQRRI